MICRSKWYGMECRKEATHIVEGLHVERHACCDRHKRMWQGLSSQDSPMTIAPLGINGETNECTGAG